MCNLTIISRTLSPESWFNRQMHLIGEDARGTHDSIESSSTIESWLSVQAMVERGPTLRPACAVENWQTTLIKKAIRLFVTKAEPVWPQRKIRR